MATYVLELPIPKSNFEPKIPYLSLRPAAAVNIMLVPLIQDQHQPPEHFMRVPHNHTRRLRLEKLSCPELPRSSSGCCKPLLGLGGGGGLTF